MIIPTFAGYKTYAVVVAYLLCVFLEGALGLDVPGFALGDDWLGGLMAVLGVGTLRAGVAKAERSVGGLLGSLRR